jgi:hypothetical protein
VKGRGALSVDKGCWGGERWAGEVERFGRQGRFETRVLHRLAEWACVWGVLSQASALQRAGETVVADAQPRATKVTHGDVMIAAAGRVRGRFGGALDDLGAASEGTVQE